jgi:hypothetical protein
MGIEHERIHLETSSVLIRQHALKHVRPHPAWAPWRGAGPAPVNALVDIPAGEVMPARRTTSYGWDNEYGRHVAQVVAFQAAAIWSATEFLEFVEAGGYADDAWWDAEGLAWKAFAQASIRHSGCHRRGWRLRLMLEEVPMPWNWPVEVNNLEATAFCAWKSSRANRFAGAPAERR